MRRGASVLLPGQAGPTTSGWPAARYPGWSTRVLLVPRLELGLVIAANRKDPSLALSVFDAVLRQVSRPAPAAPVRPPTDPLDLQGHYRSTLDDPSSFLHFASLFGPAITVERQSDSEHYTATYANVTRPTQEWTASAGGVIVAGEGQTIGVATGDPSNRAARIVLADAEAGPVAFERVPWWARAEPTLLVMLVSAITSLACLICAAAQWRSNWTTARATPADRYRIDPLWLPVAVTALITLAFLSGFMFGLAQLAVLHDDRFAFGLPAWFIGVLWLPPVLALTWVWTLRVFTRTWARPRGRWTGGLMLIHSGTLLALIATTVVWNLFGPHL